VVQVRTWAPGNTGLGLPGCKAATLLAAVALACCVSAPALDPSLDISQYAHTSWKVNEGFTKGLIVAIAQGPDGYLWLGTEFGLVRFDGVRAVPWQPPTGQQLPSNFIQKLLFARDGTFWIGTLSGLASWKDGKLTTYHEMAGQAVFPLLEDHEGTIWAGGRTKLCSIRNARMDCHGEEGSLGAGVFGLYEDTQQNLWVGVSNGFWRWKPGPPKFFPVASDGAGIRGLGEDDQHALMIGLKGGIRRFVNGHIEAHPLPYRGLATSVQQILRDRDGSLWIATLTHGLVHVHGGGADTFSSSEGLSADSVFDVREDREGNIWVATNDGLDRFRAYSVSTFSRKQGVRTTVTFSVLAATDGSVWIATPSELDRWDRGKISSVRPSNDAWKPDGTLDEQAPNSLFEDSSGRIWVATTRRFGYFDDGRFTSVSGYPGGYVYGIAEGPPGHLWVASRQSGLLQVFQGKVVQQLSWPGLGYEQYANDLAIDLAKKGLWLGFWKGGIAYIEGNKVQASYSVAEGLGQGTVNHLRFDSNGTLWAATDGGLSRIKDGNITTLTRRNGLPCDVVYWTIEDDDHAIWLYTPCGLVRVARDELEAGDADAKRTIQERVLDGSDGVRTHSWAGFSKPMVTKTTDGKIWFVTSDGVSIIDPRHLPINNVPPPVHIEQITADHRTYEASSNPRLPPLIRDLEIDYTALSLVAPEKIRFRVKLERRDPDWKDVGNERKAFYNDLPPQNYRFRVKACNNGGVWNEAGASFDFSIAPAYYQTAWFRVSCVAAFLGLLWALYRYRLRQIAQQFNFRLEERVNERTRIARELHDTLLQSFQGLMLRFQVAHDELPGRPGEARKTLENALDQAAQAITEGRDAVQGLRSSTVETNDLAQAIGSLGEELAGDETSSNRVESFVDVEGTPRNVHPILRDEIYRIAGEALRNAFRHAQARRIEVTIWYGARQFRLRVRDDGKGIDPEVLEEQGRAGHWGLAGMRERAELIGGQLEIWSQRESGTQVELSIPASLAYGASPARHFRWFAKKIGTNS